MAEQVTAFIPSWRRHENVARIIPALRAQSADPHIVLVNMGDPYDGPPADDVWAAPFNVGPFYKFLVAWAYDGWLYFNDDDILPTDPNLIAAMIDLKRSTGALIVGARAREVHFSPPHYKGRRDTTTWTNNVKMGMSLMHRRSLGRVRIPPSDVFRSDDIHVSLEVSGAARCLYASQELCGMFKDMDQLGVGLCQQDGHYEERDAYAGRWLRENVGHG